MALVFCYCATWQRTNRRQVVGQGYAREKLYDGLR